MGKSLAGLGTGAAHEKHQARRSQELLSSNVPHPPGQGEGPEIELITDPANVTKPP